VLPAGAARCWGRLDTAQLTPKGPAPSTDTCPDNVSHKPGVFPGERLDTAPSSLEIKDLGCTNTYCVIWLQGSIPFPSPF